MCCSTHQTSTVANETHWASTQGGNAACNIIYCELMIMSETPLHVARQVNCTLLRDLHPHDRDGCITFVADTHVYYIRGVASMGSAACPRLLVFRRSRSRSVLMGGRSTSPFRCTSDSRMSSVPHP